MKVRITIIAVVVAMGVFSNSWAGQTLEDYGTKLAAAQKHCEDLKKEEAKIKQASQNPNITPQQKQEAEQAATAIEKVVTATEAALKDPALKTDPEKQNAVFEQAQSAIIQANAFASSTESKLGIPHPTSVADSLAGAKAKMEPMLNASGLLTQRSRFDGSSPPYVTGDAGFKGSGVGNPYFGLGANTSTPVSVNANYAPTTPQAAEQQNHKYGGVLGGVMLEDAASGLGRISNVKYDGRYNALVMNDHLVYFMKVPSWEAAALCRDIAQDELMRVGVSMGKTNLVYGKRSTYENTSVGYNLLMADHFLGDFVFGWQKWSKGYKFPNGYVPKTTEVEADMLVQFAFKGFQFAAKNNEVELTNLIVDVRFMPVSKNAAPDGGLLPDMDALTRGYTPPAEFLANAQYLTTHFDFFRQERIISKTIAYGELAALFRSFKQVGINLELLASAMERG